MEIDALKTFESNIQSVEKLMNFDRDVQDMAIQQIEILHQQLVSDGIENDQRNGKRTLDILKHIRTNDSLRARYKTIFNQAVVLLVSYFGSALSDCFRSATQIAITYRERRILEEDINLKVDEIVSSQDSIEDVLGDLIIHKKDISFQDMKSVHRAFKKYFGIEIEKNENVNNIIVGQACRHAIVHNGGRVNSRVINQVNNAKPRKLKPNIKENENLEFSTKEVHQLGMYMKEYVSDLQLKISEYNKSLNQAGAKSAPAD